MTNKNYFALATATTKELLRWLDTTSQGLDTETATERLEQVGENQVRQASPTPLWRLAWDAYITPFSLVLVILAVISFITGYYLVAPADRDFMTPLIILVLILISGTIAFIQSVQTQKTTLNLESLVEVTAAVCRDRAFQERRTEEIVPGDLVALSAGDMIPADMRLIETTDLFVSQTSLTGESYPVEKSAQAIITTQHNAADYETLALMGCEVVSGSAKGIVIQTGKQTIFGQIAKPQTTETVETSFDKGIRETSSLLVTFMLVMAPVVILINGLTKGDWLQALLFGISVAVGLTPEMLPMIVTTNLVKGAKDMAKQETIVRHLPAIQNFGAMDVLCTDKTGTLTEDQITLEYHLDLTGNESPYVLQQAYLNSYYQTGLKNLMDIAIITAAKKHLNFDTTNWTKVDEIPFDFNRRRMSVVMQSPTGTTQLITKGAMEEMLAISETAWMDGQEIPLTKECQTKILKQVEALNEKGLRVIGIAQKDHPRDQEHFSTADETALTLIGYLAFLDPPKATTKQAIQALSDHQVAIKVLTGDNERVTRAVCEQVGISSDAIITGESILDYEDSDLRELVETHHVFVKLNPQQKAQIVRVLRANGHVVGFMGDGINDSPAMRASDVAISVDNAVDIAKESADIILLKKDLLVLEQGIVLGRQVFGNIMKYIKATTSSNFGNIFSVLMASLFLPFLPMTPVQLLSLNLIYDIACLAIPWDKMDRDYLRTPKKWEASSLKPFMFWFGPTSSIFDLTTFVALFFFIIPETLGVHYGETTGNMPEHFVALFHAGWFVESLWTQTLVLYALRTPYLPFIESTPTHPLLLITLLEMGVGSLLPFLPIGAWLHLSPLPLTFWGLVVVTAMCYFILVTIVKKRYLMRYDALL
ncbi:MAG: magnesium-translocating P-type ATPase [Aerococcus sp.]|nr:magnesium-translocating P-type ATPase [Aerococcus sp.]